MYLSPDVKKSIYKKITDTINEAVDVKVKDLNDKMDLVLELLRSSNNSTTREIIIQKEIHTTDSSKPIEKKLDSSSEDFFIPSIDHDMEVIEDKAKKTTKTKLKKSSNVKKPENFQ